MITAKKAVRKFTQFEKFKISNIQALKVKGGTSEIVEGTETIIEDEVFN